MLLRLLGPGPCLGAGEGDVVSGVARTTVECLFGGVGEVLVETNGAFGETTDVADGSGDEQRSGEYAGPEGPTNDAPDGVVSACALHVMKCT